MRRLLALALAAVSVVAVAAFAGVGRPDAAHGDTAAPGTVTTTGHGVVTAVPDTALVTAGVHTQAASAAAALAQNATLANAVVAALRAAGGSSLQTEQVALSPQTDGQGRVTGYAADNAVSVTTKIDTAGALIDAAVAAGANTVSGPSLAVSDRDALYREALGKAVADARAKADALANAGGFGVGAVSAVTEQTAGAPVPFLASGAVSPAGATPVEPGTQDITADVVVTFRIR
ncbi:MAG TPA: SIMPL domain-containing protein [Gaiellaceae bacterium]|nr:SIMPL domain-containing protein [Gaiellaceae bacterium]